MKSQVPATLELGRVLRGEWASKPADGMMGTFFVTGPKGSRLKIISSGVDEYYGWEHVSVSMATLTPNWAEMCFVKDLFWGEDECVVQYHPPRSDYVNHHPFCLHLWKPLYQTIPQPPAELVGPKKETA